MNIRERTFIMVKPDGVQCWIIGEIVKRFEQHGFKLVDVKFKSPNEELLNPHYTKLSTKLFFPTLIRYTTFAPAVAMVWEGRDVSS